MRPYKSLLDLKNNKPKKKGHVSPISFPNLQPKVTNPKGPLNSRP